MGSFVERWAGPSAVAGGIAWLVATAALILGELEWNQVIPRNPIPQVVETGTGALGTPLVVLGAWGILSGLSSGARRGTVALGAIGLALAVVPAWPWFVLGFLLWLVAAVLIGVLSLRAGLPRGPAWIMAAGVPTVFVLGPLAETALVGGSQGWGPWLGIVVSMVGVIALGATVGASRMRVAPGGLEST